MSELIKVLIVDDHETVRNLFEKEFTPEKGFLVVGSIACAAHAEAECFLKRPDVIVMDVCTEGGASGIEAAARIKQTYPNIKIIVTSGFDEITYAPRAKEIGADAFVYKSKSAAHFLEITRRVIAGERSFPETRQIPLPQGEAPFTAREMEILRLKCKSMTNAQVADELFITERTVKFHINAMLQKTGFSTAMELVIYVIAGGWINPNY